MRPEDFVQLVMIPFVGFSLIQSDEVVRTGREITLDQAFQISQRSAGLGSVLHPEIETENNSLPLKSTTAEDIVNRRNQEAIEALRQCR